MGEDKYQVTLTKEQMGLTSLALDVLARLHAGQIHYALQDGLKARSWKTYEATKAIHESAAVLKAALFPELPHDQYYGVGAREAPVIGEALTIKESLDTAVGGRDRGRMKWGSQPIPTVTVVHPDRSGRVPKAWDQGVKVENPLGGKLPPRQLTPEEFVAAMTDKDSFKKVDAIDPVIPNKGWDEPTPPRLKDYEGPAVAWKSDGYGFGGPGVLCTDPRAPEWLKAKLSELLPKRFAKDKEATYWLQGQFDEIIKEQEAVINALKEETTEQEQTND